MEEIMTKPIEMKCFLCVKRYLYRNTLNYNIIELCMNKKNNEIRQYCIERIRRYFNSVDENDKYFLNLSYEKFFP